jgi:hypothetical protein
MHQRNFAELWRELPLVSSKGTFHRLSINQEIFSLIQNCSQNPHQIFFVMKHYCKKYFNGRFCFPDESNSARKYSSIFLKIVFVFHKSSQRISCRFIEDVDECHLLLCSPPIEIDTASWFSPILDQDCQLIHTNTVAPVEYHKISQQHPKCYRKNGILREIHRYME